MSAMTVLDQLHALDAAQHFIRTQMSATDLLALLEYNGSQVQVLQDFTGDRERLQTIIATLIVGEADNTVEIIRPMPAPRTRARRLARMIQNSAFLIPTASWRRSRRRRKSWAR